MTGKKDKATILWPELLADKKSHDRFLRKVIAIYLALPLSEVNYDPEAENGPWDTDQMSEALSAEFYILERVKHLKKMKGLPEAQQYESYVGIEEFQRFLKGLEMHGEDPSDWGVGPDIEGDF